MVKTVVSQKKKMPKSALKASPLASISGDKVIAGTMDATMVDLQNSAISQLTE